MLANDPYLRRSSMTAVSSLPTDTLVFHTTQGTSDTAIIAFSGKNVEPGRFHFFNLTRNFPAAAKLLVRDPAEKWYNAGLPGVGETVEEIAGRIEREVAELGATRTVTIGTSMGGYAAILFGCMIGSERVLAFGPQTLLDLEVPILTPPPEVELQVPDLAPVMLDAPATKVELLVSWDTLWDVFHAQRVLGAASARLLSVPTAGHGLARELDEEERLWPVVGELVSGETPEVCETRPAFEPETIGRLRDAILAWQDRDHRAVADAMAPVAGRHPDWPASHYALAKGLGLAGDWAGAERALSAAMEAGPTLLRARIEPALSLIRRGKLADAREALDGMFLS
jgi:hypothetical protein